MGFDRLFKREQLIAAHRGARSIRPENTLCAFEASLGKCDFLELDVQLSRDGILVVFHDETLERTSDIAGINEFSGRRPWRVDEFDFAELQQLDFGSWFLDADPFGTIREGEVSKADLRALFPQRLLTLQQLLSFAASNRLLVNLEVKDLTGTLYDEVVVRRVVEAVYQEACAPLVLISSLKHGYLLECASLAPDIAIAALQQDEHPDDLISYLKSLGVCAYHPEDAITDAALVTMLNAAGFHVNVFTVNEQARKDQLFAFGVKSVFTDFL